MHPYVLVPLLSAVVAAAIAASILTRDVRHPAHRLAAAILLCACFWSLLEVVWNSLQTPAWVAGLVRLSALGWMPLGVLCLHLFVELGGERESRLRRWLPGLYALMGLSALLYVATPWGIESVVRTSWGWSFHFGPLFLFQYLPVAGLAAISLGVLWRRIHPLRASSGERRQGYWSLAAVGVPLATASTTDALLPLLDVHVPRLGSASMVLVGGVVAWSTHRYGYSILAPGTFAPQILAALRDGVALLRQDGVVRSANGSLGRICSCPASELVGLPMTAFLPELAAHAGEIEALETKLVPTQGPPVEVSLSCSWLRDRRGEQVGRVLLVRDVREVVAMRSRLVMSGRLAAVGELAAGIAHEINNPIAFVQSNLHQLGSHWKALAARLREQPGDAALAEVLQEGDELIEESLIGVARIARTVKEVRGFAHGGGGERTYADLNALLQETLRMVEPRLRYQTRVDCDFGDLPPLRCNPQELKQIFLNMLFNASNAVRERGGTIRVATTLEDGNAVIQIEDDGCGMPQEVRERIFDPFFTTSRANEGLGLGLALSFQIVRGHGGDIRVESAPDQGTRFAIRLPFEPEPTTEA